MNFNTRRSLSTVLLVTSALTVGVSVVRAQNSVGAATRPSITVLDSTKEQDGLLGSVRRVKIETAKIEIEDGRAVEGPARLVEVTTYGIKGNRIENTSYPTGGSHVGKEEYKYDERGNITEMTLRADSGAILSREAYSYEFDKFGNWTRMVTSLVVFENGELKREPVEVTYRTLTYYFDDTVAKAVERAAPLTETAAPIAEPIREIRVPAVPEPTTEVQEVEVLNVELSAGSGSIDTVGQPPALTERVTKPESAFAARKEKEENLEPVPDKSEAAPATEPVRKTMPAAVSSVQKLAYDLYATGREQFDAGDVRGAVELFLQSIKLEPGSAEVFLNLGHAYLKLEKDRDAIKAFKESIKLNPEAAETHYGLGFANFRARRFREAADAFRKATELNPRMAKAHYGLALSYQETGYTHGLMSEYRVLERLDSTLAKKLAQSFPQYNFSCRLLNGCP